MRPAPFALERYFAEHEFSAPYLLSSSDCDGIAMSEVIGWADGEARALWDGLGLGYTESPGHPLLRAEIAGLYEGAGADEVLVAAPQELILIAMNTMLEPGDHVVCTFPGYQSLYEIARAIGCHVSLWQAREDPARGWRFDLDELRDLLTPRTRLLIVNVPHNPTGSLLERREFEAVLELAHASGARVFCDEMYRLLEADAAQRLPSACEADEGAVCLSGMSKVFGMAGTRIGWLLTRDAALRSELAAFKDYTTICNSAPSEILALMGLRARDTILARHRERLDRNLGVLDEVFGRRPEATSWRRPAAGTIGLLELKRGGASDFCRRAIELGVMLVPSSIFDFGDAHVRIGFGRESMPEALRRIEPLLDAL